MPGPRPLDYTTRSGPTPTLWVWRLAVALAFYPLMLLISVYGGWLAAWNSLGHRPRPGWDSPAFAREPVRSAAVPAAMLLSAAWPVFIVYLALVGTAFYHDLTPASPLRRRWLILAAAVFPWAAAFLLLNADPGEVLKWAGLAPP